MGVCDPKDTGVGGTRSYKIGSGDESCDNECDSGEEAESVLDTSKRVVHDGRVSQLPVQLLPLKFCLER